VARVQDDHEGMLLTRQSGPGEQAESCKHEGLAHVRQFTWDAAARQIRDAWHRAVARHGTRRG